MKVTERLNVLVVLGARIVLENGAWKPSAHLRCRLDAAGRLFNEKPSLVVVLTGGYNVGVRYPEGVLVHDMKGEPHDFARARFDGPSEAAVMQKFLAEEWSIPINHMVLEESSATTRENALFVRTKTPLSFTF